MPKLYGEVRAVTPGSPADLAGVQPGDRIQTINGSPVRDLVDYQFYAAEEELLLGIERGQGEQRGAVEILVAKGADEELGVRFGEEPAPFIRICANKCVFCFIKGLPEKRQAVRGLPLGMRDSLYIKDDDYRYSFLFGNFITLTNLKEQDWRRLEEQRLSPLYVSVHTMNPELRRKMVDGPRAGEIIEQLQRLGRMGITCHTQLVLCPGINDGAELDRSIAELVELRPIVESISVVPVGLTKYNDGLVVEGLPALRPYTVDEAHAVMAQVAPYQQRFAAEPGNSGLPFVYLSDEWYYLTGRPFPPARHYGSYAQIENGVGMTRKLLDDWRRAKRGLHAAPAGTSGGRPRRIVIVTSAMAAPVLTRIGGDIRKATGADVRVLPVINRFWGPSVTVAGLLCAQDVLDTLTEQCPDLGADDLVLLPRVMLDNAGTRFLDDITVAEFERRVRARLDFAKTAEELVQSLLALNGPIERDGTPRAEPEAVAAGGCGCG